MNDRFFRRLAGFASLIGAIGVIVGAFGAHSLKSRIPPESLEVLKTGVQYLFVHVTACLAIAALSGIAGSDYRLLKISGLAFLIGILVFSGSLFILSTSAVTGIDINAIGIVTPLGGLCFITGWIGLAYWGLKGNKK
jgi:uncharacterized membrane protein YgdD (TMEM256/DUF423 family)